MKMMKNHHGHTLCLRITIIIFVRVYNIINRNSIKKKEKDKKLNLSTFITQQVYYI